MKKGQAATEFFLYITVFMFVAVGAFIMINYLQNTEIPVQKNRVAKEIGNGFADAIALAVRGGPGFTYRYYYPTTVYGYPYKIVFVANGTFMEWTNEYGNYSYFYATPNYRQQYVSGGTCLDNDNGVWSLDTSKQCKNVLVLNHTTDDQGNNMLIISQEN
ncbi:MAG: hypothetical protein V1492_03630 [Candidatus Micrarchaeota archaeon]